MTRTEYKTVAEVINSIAREEHKDYLLEHLADYYANNPG